MNKKLFSILLIMVLIMAMIIGGCTKAADQPSQPGEEPKVEDEKKQDEASGEEPSEEQPKEVTIVTWDKPGDTALPWQVELYDVCCKIKMDRVAK